MAEEIYVYLIKDNFTGYIKIGHSVDPEKRLMELCRQKTLLPMPNDFEILAAWEGCAEEERLIHQFFKEKHVRGEWFALDEKDIAKVRYILFDSPRYHFVMRKHCEAGLNRQKEYTKRELLQFIYGNDLPEEYYPKSL